MMYTTVTCLRPIIDEESNNEDCIDVNTNWILLLMIFISSPMTGNINQSWIERISIHHMELHQRHNIFSPQSVSMVVSTRYIHLHFPFFNCNNCRLPFGDSKIFFLFLLKMVNSFVDHSISFGSLRTTGNIRFYRSFLFLKWSIRQTGNIGFFLLRIVHSIRRTF